MQTVTSEVWRKGNGCGGLYAVGEEEGVGVYI